jgi:biotin carboxyl carrier protein
MAKFKANLNGEEREIEVTRRGDNLRVTFAGKTADLRLLYNQGPAFVVEHKRADGTHRRIRAAGHLDGDKRQLWTNGRIFTYQRVRRRAHTTADDSLGSLSTSIPAVVSKLLVEVGDVVSAGDKLILLESMKMVIPIQAPYQGTVIEINCAVGESVQAGLPLIELEKDET